MNKGSKTKDQGFWLILIIFLLGIAWYYCIPLWTIDVPGRHLRVFFFYFYWFSMTNNIEGMGPLQKISSYFGPIVAVIPTCLVQMVLVNQHYTSRTSCQTSMTSRDVNCFDQWYSLFSKPTCETVLKRFFIGRFHTRGGRFLVFLRKTKKPSGALGGRLTG